MTQLAFWEPIAEFIRWLFVPGANYFAGKSAALSGHLNRKLGGVAELYRLLEDFFKALGGSYPTRMQARLPAGFWFPGSEGVSWDIFGLVEPMLPVIRAISTGVIVLMTAIAIYHHLRRFFQE